MDIGAIIQNRYRAETVLGQGSMGTTYKARDLQTNQDVVLKQLHLSQMHAWKTLELFEREAKILKQLKHPRIPAYIEYFTFETPSDAHFVLVQEYVEGKTLRQQLEEGWRACEVEIFDIVRQVVEILDYLHRLHPPVVHRDITPQNIILKPFLSRAGVGSVYLVDFGAVQEKIRTTVFAGSTMVGTNGYVPYEQFLGHAVPASDYYALGATLLYLLTQIHPVDFPVKHLKLQLKPSFQASPKMIHLLNRLLEPVAGNRLHSPEGIRDILEKTPEELHSQKSTSAKPYGSKIEKTVRDNSLWFHIPHRKAFDAICVIVVGLIVGIGFMCGGFVETIDNGFHWYIPFSLGFSGILITSALTIAREIFGHTILALSPEWMKISHKYFGGCSTHRIPMASLQRSDITWYFYRNTRHQSQTQYASPKLGINHAGKTVYIGSGLKQIEIEWLIQEINNYYKSIFGEPLSDD